MSSNILKFTGNPILMFENQTLPAPPATVSSPIASGFKGIKAITLFLEWSDGQEPPFFTSLPNFQYTFSEFNSTTSSNQLYLGMASTDLSLPNSNVIAFENDIQLTGFNLKPVFVCWEILKPAAADRFSFTVLEVGDAANPGTIDSLFIKGSVY